MVSRIWHLSGLLQNNSADCLLYTQKHYATVKVSSVSFCTLDPKNKKLFAFINKKRRRKFCHVFQANEHDVSWL